MSTNENADLLREQKAASFYLIRDAQQDIERLHRALLNGGFEAIILTSPLRCGMIASHHNEAE